MMEELLRQILGELQVQSRQLQKLNELLMAQRKPCGQKATSETQAIIKVMLGAFQNTPLGPQLEEALRKGGYLNGI